MLDLFENGVQGTLSAMSTGLKYPVMILLILLAAWTLFLLGSLIVEIFQEHRHLKVQLPVLVDEIRAYGKGHVEECITKSGLLLRQKMALTEITNHPELTDLMRESLAVRLIAQEENFYDRRTKQTDLIAKVGPMLGLMGTLIPLGPGIIALGQGDTYTLSVSLRIAFDTTVAGLACAGVALCISTVRKGWYNNYMSILETLMECVLDEVKNGNESGSGETSESDETTGSDRATGMSDPEESFARPIGSAKPNEEDVKARLKSESEIEAELKAEEEQIVVPVEDKEEVPDVEEADVIPAVEEITESIQPIEVAAVLGSEAKETAEPVQAVPAEELTQKQKYDQLSDEQKARIKAALLARKQEADNEQGGGDQ